MEIAIGVLGILLTISLIGWHLANWNLTQLRREIVSHGHGRFEPDNGDGFRFRVFNRHENL